MNISSASQYLAYRNIASFKSSNIHKSNETTPQKTVNNSDDKKQGNIIKIDNLNKSYGSMFLLEFWL